MRIVFILVLLYCLIDSIFGKLELTLQNVENEKESGVLTRNLLPNIRAKRYWNVYGGGGGCCGCGGCGGGYGGGNQGWWRGPNSYSRRIIMEENFSQGGGGQWQSWGNGGAYGGPPPGAFGAGGGVMGLVNGILFGR